MPIDLPENYLTSVNQILKPETLGVLRNAVNKGKSYGEDGWIDKMVDSYNLGHTVRERGRPRKN